MKKILFVLPLVLFYTILPGQEKWDLRKIVDYATANNITVKQADVQASISGLIYKQSRLSQYPAASFSGNTSYNNGPSQDASFNIVNQGYFGSNLQLQTSADIFNWFSKKNTMLANQWEFEASKASTDKLKNDIALTVANNYLQILLAKEQEEIAQVQLQQTKAQLSYTRKLVNAGSLPELNAAELEAQEARDSANYINAKGNVVQATLVLKSNMNMDAAAPFEIVVPPVELIPIENIADLQPDAVYALATVNLPQQRVNDFKLKAAQKFAEAAKGDMYPSISAFGSLGTGFNSRANEIIGSQQVIAPIGKVSISGTDYSVFPNQPFTDYSYGKTAYFRQIDQNFRQSVGLSLSVPIFNGAQLRTTWERSKLTIRNVELQKEGDNQKIKQDIYQAYNAATVALEKFNSSEKSVAASQRTYDFAQKRYEVGMLSTFELITNQNNLFRAKLENVLNQFDYVFKMKVLEFYRGQGLKL
ncbi:MAG: TolC family protein [Ferruginibacter sp.]|nr:TolC family protein [Ferruginibacter sp.]